MSFKFWVQKDGVAISILPKNASTSIRAVLETDEYSNEEVMRFKTRVGILRNPHNRIKSCYSFFVDIANKGSMSDKHAHVPIDTYENFVDFILEDNSSAHWIPQMSLLGDAPTIYHRFEDLEEVWSDYFEGFYPWSYNSSPPLELPDYRLEDIETKYAEDFSIWRSL